MDPRLAAVAAKQCGVFTSAQAADAGYDAAQVRVRLANGAWVRVRRGALTLRSTYDAAQADRRSAHLLHAAAALVLTSYDASLSHRSAAIAHGLPLIGRWPDVVALTFDRAHRRRAVGVELHTARTPPHHRTVHSGMPVTTVARTVSDLARSQPFAHALAAADHALHTGVCSAADLWQVVRDCPVWPGIARTKRVLEFADRRSESPGESLSRAAIVAAGLPAPDLQVVLLVGTRQLRVDFMWPAQGLVGEFDGRVKYGATSDLWQEKQREDLIRRRYRVARWTWADVHPTSDGLVRLLRPLLQ